MSLIYETPTALSQFNFIQFKAVMDVADIDDTTYVVILRSIFAYLLKAHRIDIDNLDELTYDLIYAVYRHAKFIFETQKNKLDTISQMTDASGNKTTFEVETPSDVISVYKMYSAVPPAFL